MSRLPFDRNINPFFALFALTVIGSGAALGILRAIELAETFVSSAVM